jgi:hypothetical protein
MSSALVKRHMTFSSLRWGCFHLFDTLVTVCEDGKLFPVASLDFPFRSREPNDHVKISLAWKDPELDKIFPASFGTRMHFTFISKPIAFINPKTGY